MIARLLSIQDGSIQDSDRGREREYIQEILPLQASIVGEATGDSPPVCASIDAYTNYCQ